jgi:UDP-N-acetylmuramyl pentapeptide phosphotransferase/UDP-N-acetylglucosamine-1-phosphate transferase
MTFIGCAVLGCLLLGKGALGPGMLALIVSAASGGFLVYNYPPARIFMGDVGAVPLGFLVSALAIKGERGHAVDLWTSVIVFSPFMVDASVVVVRRALRGARIWEAHREHYYQRLVLAGWSHRRTVGAEYLLMLGCGLIAALYEHSAEGGRVALGALLVGGYALLAAATRRVEAGAARREARD